MAGNREGGLKATITNKKNDPDFYRKIGKMGGEKSRGGGWANNPELARIAGAKGGKVSRRGKSVKKVVKQEPVRVKLSLWERIRGYK